MTRTVGMLTGEISIKWIVVSPEKWQQQTPLHLRKFLSNELNDVKGPTIMKETNRPQKKGLKEIKCRKVGGLRLSRGTSDFLIEQDDSVEKREIK
ncbi:hypothetical protein RUM43_012295 [Polyplax serrata]|uniref:Uncharacterized protein n=1 Tax=Polyplax serrata TaxID=468196 RepID=A0AAN8PTL4_POLSC